MDERTDRQPGVPPPPPPPEERRRGWWTRIREALGAPELARVPVLPESWARRVTDERNLWLSAVQEQLQGDFGESAVRYLEDAHRERAQGRRARAALSLASTGFVLKQAGEEELAVACYRESARQFRSHADDAVTTSPREALWSLERAGLFFRLGRLPEQLEEVRQKYAVLNAALHPDQAEKVADVFAKAEAEPKGWAVAGGPLPTRGVRISREYTARLERLLERF